MEALTLALATALLTPCPTEDSTNCHWNAGESGTSFLALQQADGSDLVIYANGTFAVFN